MMNVPFIDIKRSIKDHLEKTISDWSLVLKNAEFVGGARVSALEEKLSFQLGSKFSSTCANGTDALIIALKALGFSHGDKIAIPNLTFWATLEAVVHIGAVPILLDVNPETLNLDLATIDQAHKKYDLNGLILVHLMGWASPETLEIRDFCAKNAIKILEDGAQSYGVKIDTQSLYKNANAITLSFYPAKVLGGAMDGGAFCSNDLAIANQFKTLCNHGRSGHYSYSHIGFNSRMGGAQAAFLLNQIEHVESMIQSRLDAHKFYAEALNDKKFTPYIKFHNMPKNVESNGYLCVTQLLMHDPEKVKLDLAQKGVGCGRTYPETLCMQAPLKDLVQKDMAIVDNDLTHSKNFCSRVLNLPLFAGITIQECQYVVAQLWSTLQMVSS